MASLRARVLASVLLLAAAGLVLLGAVPSAEPRWFLRARLDQEVRGAVPALSQILDSRGFLPAGSKSNAATRRGGPAAEGTPRRGPGNARGEPGGGPLSVNLPPG